MCSGGHCGVGNRVFLQLKVFDDVDNKITIAQEEIVRQVLSIIGYAAE
ncbi:hypothetical protein ABFA25_02615 [Mycobacterium lepromatosis]|nr:hypothetical protein [Mycobacterium lepromatosis]